MIHQTPDGIIELAACDIVSGSEAAFIAAMEELTPVFEQARGCLGIRCIQSLDQPQRFIVMVRWKEIDDHRVHFKNSDGYRKMSERLGPHIRGDVKLEYMRDTIAGFVPN